MQSQISFVNSLINRSIVLFNGRWLSLSGQSFGRPISGQMEVIGATYADSSSYWKAQEGVFVRLADIGMGSFVRDDLGRKIEHNEL